MVGSKVILSKYQRLVSTIHLIRKLVKMAYVKKTWHEKMATPKEFKIKTVDKDFADMPKGSTMLIATPKIVAEYIKNIPFGTQSTLQQMRVDLANEHGAQHTCPITAGIFLRIVAEAAYDEIEAGKSPEEVLPFWRIVNKDAKVIKKLTCGATFVMNQRKKEKLK